MEEEEEEKGRRRRRRGRGRRGRTGSRRERRRRRRRGRGRRNSGNSKLRNSTQNLPPFVKWLSLRYSLQSRPADSSNGSCNRKKLTSALGVIRGGLCKA